MRKIFNILLFLILVSCHQPNPLENLNKPPHMPIVIFPPSDTTGIDVDMNLSWSGGDPDAGDVVRYDVYLEANNPEPTKIDSDLTVNTYHPDSLQFNTKYYWKIIAKDNQGEQTTSPVWWFITRHEFNQPPYIPSNPVPASGSFDINIQNVVLQWQGGDSDSFSVVFYDVYFDTISPPGQLLSSNKKDTTDSLSLLDYDTKYFWKIVAKDNYGDETEGPIWNFTTKSATTIFTESFDNYPIDAPPPADSGWAFWGEPGTLFITDSVFFGNGGKSCQFIDTTKENTCGLAKTLNPKAIGVIEFAWRVDRSNDYLGMRLYPDSVDQEFTGPQISVRGDSLEYYDSDWTWKYITLIDSTEWYRIRIVFDCTNQYYDIYVNGDLTVVNAGWVGTDIASLKYLYFMTFKNRTCSAGYIDEISYSSAPQFLFLKHPF